MAIYNKRKCRTRYAKALGCLESAFADETTSNMLALVADEAVIAAATGLSVEQVKALRS